MKKVLKRLAFPDMPYLAVRDTGVRVVGRDTFDSLNSPGFPVGWQCYRPKTKGVMAVTYASLVLCPVCECLRTPVTRRVFENRKAISDFIDAAIPDAWDSFQYPHKAHYLWEILNNLDKFVTDSKKIAYYNFGKLVGAL